MNRLVDGEMKNKPHTTRTKQKFLLLLFFFFFLISSAVLCMSRYFCWRRAHTHNCVGVSVRQRDRFTKCKVTIESFPWECTVRTKRIQNLWSMSSTLGTSNTEFTENGKCRTTFCWWIATRFYFCALFLSLSRTLSFSLPSFAVVFFLFLR